MNSSLGAGNAPLAPMILVKVGVPNGFGSSTELNFFPSTLPSITIYVCKKKKMTFEADPPTFQFWHSPNCHPFHLSQLQQAYPNKHHALQSPCSFLYCIGALQSIGHTDHSYELHRCSNHVFHMFLQSLHLINSRVGVRERLRSGTVGRDKRWDRPYA